MNVMDMISEQVDVTQLIDPFFNSLEHLDAKSSIYLVFETVLALAVEAIVTLIKGMFHVKIHWRRFKNWVLPDHMQRQQKPPKDFAGTEPFEIELLDKVIKRHGAIVSDSKYPTSQDRNATTATRFFEMLEQMSLSGFLTYNLTLAWKFVQPNLQGTVELYSIDLWQRYGSSFEIAGFTRERIRDMMMNSLYNIYF